MYLQNPYTHLTEKLCSHKETLWKLRTVLDVKRTNNKLIFLNTKIYPRTPKYIVYNAPNSNPQKKGFLGFEDSNIKSPIFTLSSKTVEVPLDI